LLAPDIAIIQNRSELPIYDVWTAASARLRDGYIAIGHMDFVPPGIYESEMIGIRAVDEVTGKKVRLLVLFRDAAGRYWIRREDGRLEDADEDEWNYERHVLDQTRDRNPGNASAPESAVEESS
jgi:hypothetical protein